uniref:Leucine-rich repeat-containing N-terminal plant-type domain-containing protein n=1 Tax=Aegilops tauschii TaxID=37682 RepID=R7VZG9_AEGTA
MHLLHELDLSNNRLVGAFPDVVLRLPSLRYLDLRYNEFEGPTPDNVGNSPASVLVLANNDFGGCLPASVANMSGTLNEIILMNTGLKSCVPPELGMLTALTVLDVSHNQLMGAIPAELANLHSIEQLDLGHNRLSGDVPEGICHLPHLQNFTYSYNYITGEPPVQEVRVAVTATSSAFTTATNPISSATFTFTTAAVASSTNPVSSATFTTAAVASSTNRVSSTTFTSTPVPITPTSVLRGLT